jgi:ABC-type glycerol-3-phosphate transport system substrate-binding protein
MLVANGGNYFDDAFQPIFDSEAGQATAQWMVDLYEAGAIPSDTTNLLWPEVAQNFCDGNMAFYLEWYGWYSYFQDPDSCAVAGKFDLTRGPTGLDPNKHTGWAGAHAFSIPKAAQNKEAAAQLIKFFTSQQVAYDEGKLGLLPVRDDVWQLVIEDAGASGVPLDKKRLEVAQLQISEDFFTPPLFADWISFTNLWYPLLQSIILGDVSVEDGLNDAVEQTRQLMEDAGYYSEGATQQTLEKPAVAAPAPAGEPQYAGLDKDLSGVTIRMANIGGQPYEAMYESIKEFEAQTGAKVEIVFLGDGFQIDRYLKQNYAAGTVDFDVAWNHTSFMSQYTPFVEDLQQYFTPEELAAFSPAIIEAATIDGALQLIPRHADISAMHYRTDLFGDADLQAKFEAEYGYPLAPPETIEQMQQMAEFFVKEGVVEYGSLPARKRLLPAASTSCWWPTAATTSTTPSNPSSPTQPV